MKTSTSLTIAGAYIKWRDDQVKAELGHDSSFFCSELVARAYESVGLRLTKHPAYAVAPGTILESEALKLVKIIRMGNPSN